MNDWVLGIDPGKAGGFAVLYEDGSLETWAMPKKDGKIIRLIEEFASKDGCKKIYLEEVWGRRGNSMKSASTFMKHTGFLRGSILTAYDLSRGGFPLFAEVKPQKWQKDLGCPQTPRDKKLTPAVRKRIHKNDLKKFAALLWPKHKFTLLTCDAALIAKWGAMQVWDGHDLL